jgi:hypothetical protein
VDRGEELAISSLRRLLSLASERAEASTRAEEEPVSVPVSGVFAHEPPQGQELAIDVAGESLDVIA